MRGGRPGGTPRRPPSAPLVVAVLTTAAIIGILLIGVANITPADITGDLCMTLDGCGTTPGLESIAVTLGFLVVFVGTTVLYLQY